MRFSLCIPAEVYPTGTEDTFLPAWIPAVHRALELASGPFYAAYIVDHLPFGGPQLESFTTLSYFSGMFPRLHFGQAVLNVTLRSPALMAVMASNLQFLTGGRYIFGIGAGWCVEENAQYGIDFPPNTARVDRLDEALQVIRALWGGEPVDFHGRYYRLDGAVCAPVPRPPPPVMVGAFRPRMLALAARHADIWNVSSTGPAAYRRMSAGFERACAEVSRDPSTVRRSWIGGIACAATREAAESLAGERISAASEDDFGFVGTPREIIDQMRRLIDLGVDELILDPAGFPDLGGLERIINEVLPLI